MDERRTGSCLANELVSWEKEEAERGETSSSSVPTFELASVKLVLGQFGLSCLRSSNAVPTYSM